MAVSAVIALAVVDLDPFEGRDGEDVYGVGGSGVCILAVVAAVDVDVVRTLVFCFGYDGAEAR